MYYKLAINNLVNQKVRSILTITGISIGTATLIIVIAFSAGIKNAIITSVARHAPLTQITVEPPTQEGGFIKSITTPKDNEIKITNETLNKIKEIKYVKEVSPQLNYDNISSLKVNIWNQGFQTDAMIFGLPYEFIKEDIKNKKTWTEIKEPYPALISRNIINLYNLTVAPTNNLPVFSEKDITGLEITLMPGISTFFPTLNSEKNSIKVKIIGFSDRVDLIGVTIPIEVVRELNTKESTQKPYRETYLKAYITVDDTKNIEYVTTEIEKLNLKSKSTLKEVQVFEDNFKIIIIGFGMIGIITFFVAGLMIANTYISNINERKKEIGLFRALGATRSDIRKIFLAEASLIGLIGGVVGSAVAWISGFIIDVFALKEFPEVTAKPETLIQYDISLILKIIIFTIIISVLFAFIPSTKASYIEPLKALNQN